MADWLIDHGSLIDVGDSDSGSNLGADLRDIIRRDFLALSVCV